MPSYLLRETIGELLSEVVVRSADLRGDRESGRHGKSQGTHLRQVGTLASKQLLLRRIAFGVGFAEVVQHLGGRCVVPIGCPIRIA